MVRFATRFMPLLLLWPVALFGQDPPNQRTAPTEQEPSEQQIDQWISQLGAAQFDTRDRATQALIAAGRAAIPRALKAVNGRDREVALRSVVTLQEIGARGDSDTLQAALEALESAAAQAMSPAVARQATDALAS